MQLGSIISAGSAGACRAESPPSVVSHLSVLRRARSAGTLLSERARIDQWRPDALRLSSLSRSSGGRSVNKQVASVSRLGPQGASEAAQFVSAALGSGSGFRRTPAGLNPQLEVYRGLDPVEASRVRLLILSCLGGRREDLPAVHAATIPPTTHLFRLFFLVISDLIPLYEIVSIHSFLVSSSPLTISSLVGRLISPPLPPPPSV
ncbi:uncharacterized protein VTP21DRAFT_3330 [Calcarisporiella thermophila]|uniref:uncharacterized protein n=1 Tax=Calcarisporiella thermophila TaxID=911321 RepID=UPI0037443F06